jgi:hypothetical protein
MKKLIVLLLVLAPICGFAQSGRFIDSPINRLDNQNGINRLDNQNGNVISGNVIYWNAEQASEETKIPLHQVTPQSASSFSVTMVDGNSVSFDAGGLGTILGTIRNLTSDTIKIKFSRVHLRISPKWSGSICFGADCYSPKTDSIDDEGAYAVVPNGDPGEFRLNIEAPSKTSDSLVDYVKFSWCNSEDHFDLSDSARSG